MSLDQMYAGFCDNCGLVLELTHANNVEEATSFLQTQGNIVTQIGVFCDERCEANETDSIWNKQHPVTITYQQYKRYRRLLINSGGV